MSSAAYAYGSDTGGAKLAAVPDVPELHRILQRITALCASLEKPNELLGDLRSKLGTLSPSGGIAGKPEPNPGLLGELHMALDRADYIAAGLADNADSLRRLA